MLNGDDKTKLIYYTPDNVNGLLKTMNACKSYRLCFDDLNSVNIIDKSDSKTPLTKAIYPGYINDLSALKRSERYFEIGPELKINELLKREPLCFLLFLYVLLPNVELLMYVTSCP